MNICVFVWLAPTLTTEKPFGETDDILLDLGLDTSTMFKKLDVMFGSSDNVEFGNNLTLDSVQEKPIVDITRFTDSPLMTLIMVDPDARSRANPTERVRLFKLQ